MQQFIDSYDFTGKKAIVRVDFNVPLNAEFQITDDTRIRAAIPTLKKVLEKGGSLIIMSHLGRPKGVDAKFSLKHIVDHVAEKLGTPVQFAEDCMKADEQAAALKPGEVLLLENLRYYAEEEGKPRGLAEDASDEEKKAAKAAVKESQKGFVKTLADYAVLEKSLDVLMEDFQISVCSFLDRKALRYKQKRLVNVIKNCRGTRINKRHIAVNV